MQPLEGVSARFLKSAAKIRAAHRVVFQKLRAGTGRDDRAGLQNVAAVGDGKRHLRVLLDKKDRRARLDAADG